VPVRSTRGFGLLPLLLRHCSRTPQPPRCLSPAVTLAPAHGPGAHCLRSAISRARAPVPNGAHTARPGPGPGIRVPHAARLIARDPAPAVSAAASTVNLLDPCTYCSRALPARVRLVPRRGYMCKPGTGTASAVMQSDCNKTGLMQKPGHHVVWRLSRPDVLAEESYSVLPVSDVDFWATSDSR
jgi:hypothetical protein